MKKTKIIIVLLSLLFLSAIIPKNLLQTRADASTRSDYVLVTKLASNTNKTDTKYEIYADSAHHDASNKILHDGASIKVVYTGQVGAYHIRLSVSNLWSAEFISTSPYQSKIFTLKLSKQTNKAVPLNLEINDPQDIYSDQGVITVGPAQNLVTIDDGISNWTETPQNTIGQIKTGDNQYLCYTFGNADGTLTSADGGNMKPMFNIFLKDNGKTVATFSNANRGLASSYDYGLITDRDGTNPHLGDTSLPYNLENFKTYKGTDANGKTALKAVGSYSVGIQVEMLLRPAADDSTIQQEMYLLNTSDSALTSGGIFFAKDTELDGNDGVPIYAQAKNNGFYMQTDNYKVFMNMKVPDGLQNYVTENYHQSGDEANGQTITNSMSAKSSAESASSRVTIPVEKTTYQLENTQLQFSNVELTKLSSDQPSTAVDNSVVVSDFKLTPSGQAQTLVTRTIMQRVPAIIQKLKRMIILVIQPGTIISGIKKPRITVSGCIF